MTAGWAALVNRLLRGERRSVTEAGRGRDGSDHLTSPRKTPKSWGLPSQSVWSALSVPGHAVPITTYPRARALGCSKGSLPRCQTEYEMQSVDEWIARQDVKMDSPEGHPPP